MAVGEETKTTATTNETNRNVAGAADNGRQIASNIAGVAEAGATRFRR